MPFPFRFRPVPILLLTAEGHAVEAIIRGTTDEDAAFWEDYWQPMLLMHDCDDGTWEFSAHIRRAAPTLLSFLLPSRRRHLCLAVECQELVEAMISLTLDQEGRYSEDGDPIVYVEYLGNAPENHPRLRTQRPRRTRGATVNLMLAACILAKKAGVGRVCLDSKLEATDFYRKIGMRRGRKRLIEGVEYEYFEAGPDEMESMAAYLETMYKKALA